MTRSEPRRPFRRSRSTLGVAMAMAFVASCGSNRFTSPSTSASPVPQEGTVATGRSSTDRSGRSPSGSPRSADAQAPAKAMGGPSVVRYDYRLRDASYGSSVLADLFAAEAR